MTKYIVRADGKEDQSIIETDGVIIDAGHNLDWVGSTLLEYAKFCKEMGLVLIPIINEKVTDFSYKGEMYRVLYGKDENEIRRIFRLNNNGDWQSVSFSALPRSLRIIL